MITLKNDPLSIEERLQVAGLIYDTLPDFYGTLPQDKAATCAMIAAEMDIAGTECHAPLMAERDGTRVGVICAFPVAELQARQQASMLHVMRTLDGEARKAFRQAMRQNNHTVAPLMQTEGVYIARIAVDVSARGVGVGQQVFAAFRARHPAVPVALHVDRDNAQAIGFYTRLGFVFDDDGSAKKRVMVLD